MNNHQAPERMRAYVHEHPNVARTLSFGAVACLTGLGLVISSEVQHAARQHVTYERDTETTGALFRFWQSQAEKAMGDDDPSTVVHFSPPAGSSTYEVIYTFNNDYRVRFSGKGQPLTGKEALHQATAATTCLTP